MACVHMICILFYFPFAEGCDVTGGGEDFVIFICLVPRVTAMSECAALPVSPGRFLT